jgi:hypothetical protein
LLGSLVNLVTLSHCFGTKWHSLACQSVANPYSDWPIHLVHGTRTHSACSHAYMRAQTRRLTQPTLLHQLTTCVCTLCYDTTVPW